METMLKTALFIHIATGMIALLTGMLAMLFKKGRKNHRISGQVYFWCMMIVAVTALFMSITKDIRFLTLIAIFSFYLSYSGYRVIIRRRTALSPDTLPTGEQPPSLPGSGQQPNPQAGMFPASPPGSYRQAWRAGLADWIMALILVLNGLYMTGSGSLALSRGTVELNPVLLVFGIACLLFAVTDIRRFSRKSAGKNEWLFHHMGMMLGSYIATFTAFLVVNVQMNPAWLPWLLPAVIGTPLISIWIARYKRKKGLLKSVH